MFEGKLMPSCNVLIRSYQLWYRLSDFITSGLARNEFRGESIYRMMYMSIREGVLAAVR